MSPVDIRSAKQVGRLLRSSREAQSVDLNHLSKRCGLSVAQLVHIESGNLFAFEENLQKMMSYSNIYANVLNVDVNTLGQEEVYVPKDIDLRLVGSNIPRFLLKQS